MPGAKVVQFNLNAHVPERIKAPHLPVAERIEENGFQQFERDGVMVFQHSARLVNQVFVIEPGHRDVDGQLRDLKPLGQPLGLQGGHAAKHVMVDGRKQAGVQRLRQELVRREGAACRAVPAHQRLGPGKLKGCGIELRLEEAHDFVGFQRVAQVLAGVRGQMKVGADLRRIGSIAIASGPLGHIQCRIGIDEGFGRGRGWP